MIATTKNTINLHFP